jgi:hypothetical protein
VANLSAVLKQLAQERVRLTAQLTQIENALSALKVSGTLTLKRRKLSAAALARIRAAQKARWEKWRKAHKRGKD